MDFSQEDAIQSSDYLYIDESDVEWEIDTGSISQTQITQSQQVGQAGNNSADDDWKITTSGSTSISGGTVSTGGTVSIGSGNASISIGPDEEKAEKLREIAEEQLEKVDRLRDIVIDWIVDKNPSRKDKVRWKRDLDQIGEYKRDLEDALSEGEQSGNLVWNSPIREEQILDPSQLDKLNEIYRRWT